MNIKALITTVLVLGSSSVAMARPYRTPVANPVIRDHRTQPQTRPMPLPAPIDDCAPAPVYHAPPYVPTWTSLGTVNVIKDGEMAFPVSPYAARFSTLKLQSSAGKSLIYRVQIEFANGRLQVVELNQYLMAASSPTITIDLEGNGRSAIRNVTVIGRNARQSSYSVLAV